MTREEIRDNLFVSIIASVIGVKHAYITDVSLSAQTKKEIMGHLVADATSLADSIINIYKPEDKKEPGRLSSTVEQ